MNCVVCGREIPPPKYSRNRRKTCSRKCLRQRRKEVCASMSAECFTHGDTVHGKIRPEFRAWVGAKTRCYDQKNPRYPHYGGRGIKVCDRWLGANGYVNFLADMGRKPSRKHSLDRRNNDGNYEPDNCRWATKKVQAQNRRPGHAGRKLTDEQVARIKQGLKAGESGASLARMCQISESVIYQIKLGKYWKGVGDGF